MPETLFPAIIAQSIFEVQRKVSSLWMRSIATHILLRVWHLQCKYPVLGVVSPAQHRWRSPACAAGSTHTLAQKQTHFTPVNPCAEIPTGSVMHTSDYTPPPHTHNSTAQRARQVVPRGSGEVSRVGILFLVIFYFAMLSLPCHNHITFCKTPIVSSTWFSLWLKQRPSIPGFFLGYHSLPLLWDSSIIFHFNLLWQL